MNTNSFGTSSTDCLMLGDLINQVTADTGSTVSMHLYPLRVPETQDVIHFAIFLMAAIIYCDSTHSCHGKVNVTSA